jgi:hypothetical protein
VSVGTAAAVIAAGTTVLVTSHSPTPPGPPQRGTYVETLATIPLALTSSFTPVNDDVYVDYNDGSDGAAEIKGTIKNVTTGEIVRVYAQQFPYTTAPVAAGSDTLNPTNGSASYAFRVTPTLATRYQVKLFAKATASTPLASSTITTVYVAETMIITVNNQCTSRPVCHASNVVTVYIPPSAIKAEAAKHRYAYLGAAVGPSTANPPPPATAQLGAGNITTTAAHLTGKNSLSFTITFSYTIGNNGANFVWTPCTKDTEAQDGLGLPGSHGCGNQTISVAAADNYLG